jgi:hypothetical protein
VRIKSAIRVSSRPTPIPVDIDVGTEKKELNNITNPNENPEKAFIVLQFLVFTIAAVRNKNPIPNPISGIDI